MTAFEQAEDKPIAAEKPRRSLGHVPELDGMRGCAAIAVFVLHLFITVNLAPNQVLTPGLELLLRLVGLGAYGVDVFFVLSGFLITSLLLIDREKPHFFWNFYWKRVLRIQPVYLLHLLFVWFLVQQSHGYVFLALIFLVNFDGFFHVPDMGPAWTLSIEEQFYLLWPQVIRRASTARVYQISLGLIVFSVSARVVMSLVFGHMAIRYTFYRLDGLGLGALLALQWIERQSSSAKVQRVLRVLNGRGTFALALGYFVWCAVVPWGSWPALSLFAVNVLAYRAIRFILHHPRTPSLAWLRSGPMVYLGAISYSLYMFHTLILRLYDRWVGPPSTQAGPFLLRALAVSIATVVVCTVSRYAVELPAQSLRRFVLR